ncbi:MAG: PLP-dependent aminotransferase family protein [Verrucomicrobiota bacterium]
MTIALERPDVLSLAAGFTDNDSLPMEQVSGIVKGFEGRSIEEKTVLQYGTNQGRAGLREAICRRLEGEDGQTEGAYSSGRCFITNGSQQALYLAMQTLCDEGDIVFVEDPSYFVFLEILDGLGIEARPMPILDSGRIDLAALERDFAELKDAGELARVKAVYLVSYFANPTGQSVDQETKRGVGQLVSEFDPQIAIIEDAAYRELYFETPYEAKSCLAYEEFENLSVLYTSTLTKPFATGLKVGYGYCNDEDWLARMLAVKGQHDFGTSHFTQAVLERAIEEGIFDHHLGHLRRIYFSKVQVLDDVLRSGLERIGWQWERPRGGLYFWMKAPGELATDFDSEFHAQCIEQRNSR